MKKLTKEELLELKSEFEYKLNYCEGVDELLIKLWLSNVERELEECDGC